jgi:hypothetical protein
MEIDASQEVDLYDSSLCMENEMTKFGEEKPECDNCSDPAGVYCKECGCYYCKQCADLRHKHSKKQGHHVSPLNSKDSPTGTVEPLYSQDTLGNMHILHVSDKWSSQKSLHSAYLYFSQPSR